MDDEPHTESSAMETTVVRKLLEYYLADPSCIKDGECDHHPRFILYYPEGRKSVCAICENERLQDELTAASNMADKFGDERDEARHVARHFYHEAVSEGPQDSDEEWTKRNPWLLEDD